MTGKLTKTDMIDAIALHFRKRGQRLSNLQKSPIKKLEEIIKKYNLNMDELLEQVVECREKDKIAEQKRKEERDRRDAEYALERKQKEDKKKMMWRTLSDEDKLKVKKIQYDRYVETTTKENVEAKLTTDRMEEMYKKQGLSSYSLIRENDNTLIVKGVRVINGWISTIKSQEEYEKNEDDDGKFYDFDYWTAVCRYNEDLILNLYEAEMLKQGFWKGDDGEFYKTIRVKKQNK
jgi:hypothetical protein